MPQIAQVGDFCPYPQCPDYGKPQNARQMNLEKYGLTHSGRQRYHCKACGRTFSDTQGTLFYRRRTSADDILETLALIAEGSRISSIARVKGHKADTILDWLRHAARHVEAIEAALLARYTLKRGQLDAMWSYIKRKRAKGGLPPATMVKSGARR
jgi:transposase-like protein